ncbi:hypothetical protein OEZ86_012118 [Tetradesmus obliquus]|uniref:Knr4/Smi1-like domain-containing protein n=1 Tax=Tetradesmus obliquus TaxID=3088 RepID=A0ABY8TKB8_TETOB|nr:hypothetical protein OEZ85_008948 [Tetradesmus obliquus]WIA29631.1 hypothetical protein OEZ86_012118 [Tetradesmus obliquus]
MSNAGQLLRLALACRQNMRMVAEAEWFWQQQCEHLGWLSSASPWFDYFRLRMASRWRLRTLMRKYMPFLNIHSRLAFEPGASIAQLAAVEDRLGMRLPWELWEVLRFRAGQAAGGHVSFVDSCRLLGLNELHVLHIDAPARPSLSPKAAAPGAAAASGSKAVIAFLSNTMGSTAYGVAQDASVHIVRGFTQRRVAGSMSGFLQHLLT